MISIVFVLFLSSAPTFVSFRFQNHITVDIDCDGLCHVCQLPHTENSGARRIVWQNLLGESIMCGNEYCGHTSSLLVWCGQYYVLGYRWVFISIFCGWHRSMNIFCTLTLFANFRKTGASTFVVALHASFYNIDAIVTEEFEAFLPETETVWSLSFEVTEKLRTVHTFIDNKHYMYSISLDQ